MYKNNKNEIVSTLNLNQKMVITVIWCSSDEKAKFLCFLAYIFWNIVGVIYNYYLLKSY